MMVIGVLCTGCVSFTATVEPPSETNVVENREDAREEDNRGLSYLITGNETPLQLAAVASAVIEGNLAINGSLALPAASNATEAYVNIDIFDERGEVVGQYGVLARPVFSKDALSFTLETDVPADTAAGYTLLIYGAN
ncbi:MAG: hypothetical protein KDE31_37850 [Caldilineaceae bacterium]|nr:hypothetical protein [Caldilineaceae bacterium]